MNKRIESLRKEAGLTPCYEDQSVQIQKFAELIVKECISKLDDIGVIDRDSRTIAMKVISKHFGVEK